VRKGSSRIWGIANSLSAGTHLTELVSTLAADSDASLAASAMLDVQDRQEAWINDQIEAPAYLASTAARTADISAGTPSMLAWLTAWPDFLPLLCKDWTDHVSADMLQGLRDMHGLLEQGIPAAVSTIASILKTQASACARDAGMRAWISCLSKWAQLRSTLQVC
jgi:hypothetical protein